MKKLIILSLIITSLFVISCKGSGGGDSSKTTTTAPATTPIEGRWGASETVGTATASMIFIFTGTNVSYSMAMVDTDPAAPSSVTLVFGGTFRLDGNNLYTTFKTATATVSNGSTTVTMTDLTEVTNAAGGSLPVQVDNTEHLFGTYAVNGNTLTLTPTGNSAQNFTKQ